MAFYIGQKVVCIDDTREPEEPAPWVVKDRIYTISSIEVGFYTREPVLCFEEISSPAVETDSSEWDQGFDPDYFRPVAERKTDTGMAILKGLLTGKKAKKPAKV